MTSISARNAGLDGYVHKFRFEREPHLATTEPEIVVEDRAADSAPGIGTGSGELRLLVGFVISVIVLSALLLAVVSAIRP